MSYFKIAYIGNKADFACRVHYVGAQEDIAIPRGTVISPAPVSRISLEGRLSGSTGRYDDSPHPAVANIQRSATDKSGYKSVWSSDGNVVIIMDEGIETLDVAFLR